MNPIIRNILAVVIGVFIGGIVNSGIVMISGSVIPPPPGVDVTTAEGLEKGIHLFEFKHFIMPFLAHALGAFAGGYVASLIAASHKMKFALLVGALFFAGGIMAATMIPAPVWFIIVDLLLAYFPFAYVGGKWGQGIKRA
ncbi:MAG: hypothetical protein JNJ99_09625 [Crocinitomicaceae bacterium]|nr:hypothetical protein [Crocinitomicaceae bacterium]